MGLTALQPPAWPRPRGYSNAMLGQGRMVLISGQIGWDATEVMAQGLVAQVRQALLNILEILAQAQAGPEHIARLTWYVTDRDTYRASGKELGLVWREVMGRHYPAMAVLGCPCLVERDAMVEITAEAILPPA